MSEGWVKLHRCLLDKPIWNCSTSEQKSILITILLLANRSEKEWEWQNKKFRCQPGQFVTSSTNLAKAAGCSRQNVRTALARFEKYEFLTYESTKTGILVTLVNWEKYQAKPKELTNQSTNDQPTGNQQVTTNKNDKNDKKTINSDFEVENFFKECCAMYPNSKGQTSNTQKKELYKLGDLFKECIREYLKFVDSEHNRGFDLAYKNRSTFFNSGYKDYLETVKENNVPKPDKPLAGQIRYIEG